MKFTKIVLLTFLAYSLLSGCITMPKKSETTFLSGKDIGPARFTPDGNEIVFSIRTEKSSNIYKVKTDGTGLVALTKGDTFDFDPVYSPDGAKILFSSISNNKQADLCLMKPDGSEKIFLTTGPEHDFNPIFSPDGKRIFFLRAAWWGNFSPVAMPAWHNIDVYSINIDGSDLKRITFDRYYRIGDLSISPDGKTLMATLFEYKGLYSVWQIPIDNPTSRRPLEPDLDLYKSRLPLLNLKAISYDRLYGPEFSPDGTSLLFTWEGHYSKEYRREVYIMDMKTNKAKRVTNLEGPIYDAHFSKDGSRLVFRTVEYINDGLFSSRSEPRLWIINKDGSRLKQVDIK